MNRADRVHPTPIMCSTNIFFSFTILFVCHALPSHEIASIKNNRCGKQRQTNECIQSSVKVGSAKPLDKPALPGSGFKVLGEDGYDDGGVADLSLLIDLEDSVQRRKRGENEYFTALKADLLPRATRGPMAKMTRREQKVSLAQLLFSEDDDCEDKGPSEVYVEQVTGDEDDATLKHRADRLAQARAALRLSLLLREPACASLSLSELCKRKLTQAGRDGAIEALRCADKALEIAGPGFWDSDEVQCEVRLFEPIIADTVPVILVIFVLPLLPLLHPPFLIFLLLFS